MHRHAYTCIHMHTHAYQYTDTTNIHSLSAFFYFILYLIRVWLIPGRHSFCTLHYSHAVHPHPTFMLSHSATYQYILGLFWHTIAQHTEALCSTVITRPPKRGRDREREIISKDTGMSSLYGVMRHLTPGCGTGVCTWSYRMSSLYGVMRLHLSVLEAVKTQVRTHCRFNEESFLQISLALFPSALNKSSSSG